jgi:hypothetical protein
MKKHKQGATVIFSLCPFFSTDDEQIDWLLSYAHWFRTENAVTVYEYHYHQHNFNLLV